MAMTKEEKVARIRNIMAYTTGTENYHKFSMFPHAPICTSGVCEVAKAAGAFWLLDAIASHQGNKRLNPEFQVWKLTRNKTGDGAMLRGYNDTDEQVVGQRIPYTDFPLDEITLWVELGHVSGREYRIILLPNEH